jgi:hypothetical protein
MRPIVSHSLNPVYWSRAKPAYAMPLGSVTDASEHWCDHLLKGIDLHCHCLHARHHVIGDVNTEGRGRPGRQEGKAPPTAWSQPGEVGTHLNLVVWRSTGPGVSGVAAPGPRRTRTAGTAS